MDTKANNVPELRDAIYVLNLFFELVKLRCAYPKCTGSKIDDRRLEKASEICQGNFHISAQIF